MTVTVKERNPGLPGLLQELRNTAAELRRVEQEAAKALYDRKDKSAYFNHMRNKAEIIAGLPETAARFFNGLEPPLQKMVKAQVGAFSFTAAKALRLNSVFYMAALLVPDNYQDGDNNDLENLVLFLEDYK